MQKAAALFVGASLVLPFMTLLGRAEGRELPVVQGTQYAEAERHEGEHQELKQEEHKAPPKHRRHHRKHTRAEHHEAPQEQHQDEHHEEHHE